MTINIYDGLTPEAIDQIVITEMDYCTSNPQGIPEEVVKAAEVIKGWYTPISKDEEE